jgi:tetratricopeptide (TPR) repeat protein
MRKAEPLLKRALAIREKALGPKHPETAKTLSDLSLLYFFEKNPATAEGYAKRALPLEEKAFGTESLPVATTLNRMGISERDLGKFKEAEANLERALSIREEKSAPESWILISLENLASVYTAQGQEAKAMPLMARARAIRSHSSSN